MKWNRREFVVASAVCAAGAALWRGGWAQAQGNGRVEAEVGLVKEVKCAEPASQTLRFQDEDGVEIAQRKVFVWWEQQGKSGGVWHVMSAICTHLKCKIGYSGERGRFVCPCHKSEFALDGSVLKKPAKKPLTDYSAEAFERDGKLYVRYTS